MFQTYGAKSYKPKKGKIKATLLIHTDAYTHIHEQLQLLYWEVGSCSAGQQIPCFLWKPKIITVFPRLTVHILAQY